MHRRLWQLSIVAFGFSSALWGQPAISSLDPQTQTAGQRFTLTVTGSRFCSFSRIIFNGAIIPSTVIGETQIFGTIDPSLTDGRAGDVPVLVQTPQIDSFCELGTGFSNALPFTIKVSQ